MRAAYEKRFKCIIQDEITYDGAVNVKWMHGPPDKLF